MCYKNHYSTRKTTWTHLNNNMKEQGNLVSRIFFEDSTSNITQQHKSIDILKEIEPFSWIKKEIHY